MWSQCHRKREQRKGRDIMWPTDDKKVVSINIIHYTIYLTFSVTVYMPIKADTNTFNGCFITHSGQSIFSVNTI